MADVITGPRCGTRATCSPEPLIDRGESRPAVNLHAPHNEVGSWNGFADPAIFAFSLTACATFDSGLSWTVTLLSRGRERD